MSIWTSFFNRRKPILPVAAPVVAPPPAAVMCAPAVRDTRSAEWYPMVLETVDSLYQQELGRNADTSGLANYLFRAREDGKDAEWMRTDIRKSTEWIEREATIPNPNENAGFALAVYDADGQEVTGHSIIIHRTDTGAQVTERNGCKFYELFELPEGDYVYLINADGKNSVMNNVKLLKNTQIDVTLTNAITNPNLLNGDIVIRGRQTFVNGQPRILQFCHAMALFSQAVHGQWDEVERQIKVIALYYGGFRFCDTLGYWDKNRPGDTAWSAWEGKEVTRYPFLSWGQRQIPETPDYDAQMERFLLIADKYGMKVMHDRGDLNAWSRAQKMEHMRLNGRLYARLGDVGKRVLGGLWSINEAWQNGGEDIQVLVDMINAFKDGAGWLPTVVGLSASGGETPSWFLPDMPQEYRDANWGSELPEALKALGRSPATVMTIHGARGVDNLPNMLEHYFGYGYDDTLRRFNKPVWNTEPIGGGKGVSVGELNDVETLVGAHLQMLITGQISTFMSGAGVWGSGPIESMPGFKEVARLSTFLPSDIAGFQTVIHAGTGRPFSHKSILVANDPTRFDQAIHDDGRFVAVWHTIEAAAKPLYVQRNCSEFTVINPVTGVVESQGSIRAGQQLTHTGKVRLVIGRLA